MSAPVTPGVGAQRYVGQRVARKEDGRLLTGRGTFVDDIVLPGMLHCAFVRSPIARGRIVSIDKAAALDLPGVHAILSQEDLAKIPVGMISFFMTPVEVPMAALADGRVAHVGEPVALVIADNRYLAEDAASLVAVDYEEEDPVVTITDARIGALVHPTREDNIAAQMGDDEPDHDLEEALANAPHLITRTITHQRISQSPMETRGIVATRQGDDELLIQMPCQSPHSSARTFNLALGMPQINIRVVSKDVGGSFGLKNMPWREEFAVVIACLLTNRPLKWIEDRLENLTAANQAREQEMVLRAAFGSDGRLLAAHADYSCNNGAFPQGADSNIAVMMFLWAAYKMPAFSFLCRGWYTNTTGLTAYRGPWAMESLAREVLLDEAAREIGIDPVDIRRRNLVYLPDQPCTSIMGIPTEDITPGECLDKLLTVLDVKAFRAEQAAAREQGRYLGLGFATYIEPTGSAGSMPVMTGEMVNLRIEPTGKVSAQMGTFSQGHGTATTMAQVIAEHLGVPYEDVTVYEGDSSRGGYSPGAAGSRQGVIGGGACIRTAKLLKDKVKMVAAHVLNANPNDVDILDGKVIVHGVEEQTRTVREIAEIAYGEPARLPPGMETGLEVQYRYDPPPMTFTSAAHAAIVEVDAETGFVKILRWISSEDCGNVINPAVVEGQIAGGLAQAIGMVLLEEFEYDPRGNPTTVTYKDYLMPAITDVPDFEYVHANTPSRTEGGFRGVGEGGAIIGPPTLVNAIADALAPFKPDMKDLHLPLSPSRILDLIDGKPLTGRHATVAPVAAAPEPVEAAPAPSDVTTIDGSWACTLHSPVGAQAMTATFATEGDTVTGRLDSDQGAIDFTGTRDGNRVKFEIQVDKPMKLTLKYDLTFDGDQITGKVKMGMFGSSKFTGERIVSEAFLSASSNPALSAATDKAPEPEGTAIDGVWNCTLHSPVGAQAMTATFVTDGDAVTGKLDSDQGGMDFAGTREGNVVKFDLKVDKPMKLTLKYNLTFEGDRITGKVKMGMFGTSKFSGTRA